MPDTSSRFRATTTPVMAAAALEILTGAGLIAAPSQLARLLFAAGMGGSGDLVGRIAGIVMVCLATACWPRTESSSPQTLVPLFALSLLGAIYLLVVGVSGPNAGPLLWPAFVAHAVLAALLARAWLTSRHPSAGASNTAEKS